MALRVKYMSVINLTHDRIVIGVRENSVRKKLLQASNLQLQGCIDICRVSDVATKQIKAMQTPCGDTHAVQNDSRIGGKE